MSNNESYTIQRCDKAPAAVPSLADPAWAKADVAELKWSADKSRGVLPKVCCRLLHDGANIYGLYQVRDASRRACQTEYNSMVCLDSCVEFFFEPAPSTFAGYFNLEMNAIGTHLMYYIRDYERTEDGYKDFTPLPPEDGLKVTTLTSLQGHGPIDPEEFGEKEWFEFFQIPVAVLEKHHGPIGKLDGQVWRGNFYKCGDELKEPHWLGWRAVSPLNFHLPPCFGEFRFA